MVQAQQCGKANRPPSAARPLLCNGTYPSSLSCVATCAYHSHAAEVDKDAVGRASIVSEWARSLWRRGAVHSHCVVRLRLPLCKLIGANLRVTTDCVVCNGCNDFVLYHLTSLALEPAEQATALQPSVLLRSNTNKQVRAVQHL